MTGKLLSTLTCCLLVLGPACGRKSEAPPPVRRPADFSNLANQAQRQPLQPGLWILEPPDGASVPYRPIFAGTISDTTIEAVWLVVRAVGMPDYWIQPPAPVRDDGVWVCQPYVGLSDTQAGVKFEVRAVAGPQNPLAPGQKLGTWPKGRYQSNIVVVARE